MLLKERHRAHTLDFSDKNLEDAFARNFLLVLKEKINTQLSNWKSETKFLEKLKEINIKKIMSRNCCLQKLLTTSASLNMGTLTLSNRKCLLKFSNIYR